MICRITGKLVGVAGEQAVIVEIGGICYEVLVPSGLMSDMQRLAGESITLYTVQYLEGNLGGGNLTPRLLGFLAESERRFFHELLKVKGVSTRKALRAMNVPTHMIAGAIERGDERFLTSLPEIGKKTAAQMITELRGQLQSYCAPTAVSAMVPELSDAQKIALEILVQWGDRRADAQRWIAAAVEADPALNEADAIVRAAYREKRNVG